MTDLNQGQAPTQTLAEKAPTGSRSAKAKLTRNIAVSLLRVGVNGLVALVLPAYLTHRLPVEIYGAWVLILQLAAFVTFLDLGIQQGIAKYVAEYDARHDEEGAMRHASAGFALMAVFGVLGLGLTFLLALKVPQLFHNMPQVLYRSVRISVVLIGVSSSVGLVSNVFAAILLGLQRYTVPVTISIINRLAVTGGVLMVVHWHGGLATMGAGVAAANILTAALQIDAWRRLVPHIRVSFSLVEFAIFKKLSAYCSMLALWTVCMLCISGLDVTLVGHYAFDQTGFYSIAVAPTAFMLVILASVLNPLMPAASALSTHRSAAEMGILLVRITRYSTLLLLLTGLPLVVGAIPILTLWVGPAYALHSMTYLRFLVLANIIRSLCGPYVTLIAATGRMKAATLAAILEAVVNLSSSVYLASRFGAIGVAWGTLLGSFVTLVTHFLLSMRNSQDTIAVNRGYLFTQGVLRPSAVALPAILLFPLWWSAGANSYLSLFFLWGSSTLLAAWFCGFTGDERRGWIARARSTLRMN